MILVLSIIRSSDHLDKSVPIRRCIASYQGSVTVVVGSLTLSQDDISRWGCEGCEPVLSFLMSSDLRGIRHANSHRPIILIVRTERTTLHSSLSVLSPLRPD